MTSLVAARNVSKHFGDVRAVDDVSFEIEKGRIMGLFGPNGAGKTTLLKTINREIYPVAAAGTCVRILGRDNWNVWALRRHIGVVSHDLQMRYTPATTALEVVVSGFHSSIGVHGTLANRVTGAERAAAFATLEQLGVGELASTELRHMSTGQQRRCLLARALVHDPATLILDEPTAGLDLAASFDFLARIRDLAARGRNVLIVTHHLSDIPPEVDRVVLLADGRVAADGPKAEVLDGKTLSDVYGTPIRVAEIDGHYLAYPG